MDNCILSCNIGNDMVSICCRIKTINDVNKNEDKELIECASLGDIVGIDVDEIKFNNKNIN